jgi:hypothetical protein
MTSRDTAIGVATGYVRIGQQRNRGFISDKTHRLWRSPSLLFNWYLGAFLDVKAVGLEATL